MGCSESKVPAGAVNEAQKANEEHDVNAAIMSCPHMKDILAGQPEDRRKAIEFMKTKYGFREPDRGNLDDPNIKWRKGKPDYTLTNCSWMKGKTQNHAKGSLEEVVENLVKTWEAELSHKSDLEQWTTIDRPNFTIQTNGGRVVDAEEAVTIGSYNSLMEACPAYQKYGVGDNFEASHSMFHDAFTEGFSWEVLKVLSGPPNVVFTWRHWAKFTGQFKDRLGAGELVELFGLARITVNASLKIQAVEVFMDADEFIHTLEGKEPAVDKASNLIGSDITKTALENLEKNM